MNATTAAATTTGALGLMPGEIVRVRNPSQIFATLDADGKLDGMPFMPEMLKHCGRVLPVAQRADKTCAGDGAVRHMPDTVHLKMVRCDGSAHDGCQAACLLFWKEAWLERAAGQADAVEPGAPDDEEQTFVDETLMPFTKIAPKAADSAPRYRCQATEIPAASEPIRFRELSQYVRDTRNWKPQKLLRGLPFELFNRYQTLTSRFFPERLRIAGGLPYPFVEGRLAKGKTPKATLDLEPGDLVRIKSKEQIVATLDTTGRNRGLLFDGELSRFCGRTARVQARVGRLIEESNGEMIEIKSDCIILEGVVCTGDYHRFCTRAIYSYWRELWLEKLDPDAVAEPDAPCVNRWSRG